MTDCPFRSTVWGKTGSRSSLLGMGECHKKDLKQIGTSWEDIRREALNRLG